MSNDRDRAEAIVDRIGSGFRFSIAFFAAVVLISTCATSLDGMIHQTAGASFPLTVAGYVVDTEYNPIGGASVMITVLDAEGGARAVRYFTTYSNGAYQSDPDFAETEWDIGNRVEAVAVFESDYGSNFTTLTAQDAESLLTWINVTHPLKLVYPVANTPPVAAFSVTPLTGSQRTVFEFDASSSYDLENASTDLEVRWDFDGNGMWDSDWSVEKTAEWRYSDPGDYLAALEVRDGAGALGKTTRSVPVQSSAPTASFTWSAVGLEVSVNASTSSDPEGTIVIYEWDFGDGSYSTGVTAAHTYGANGTYDILLTVTNDIGLSDFDDESVTVRLDTPFDLPLVAGWNFVTVPLLGYGYKASTLGLKTNDIVAGWNPATQTYDKNYIVGVSLPFKDFFIEASTGYWIYTKTPQTLTLQGTVPTTQQSRSITVPGTGSWVIIGFNSLSTTMHANQVPGMYSGGSVTQVVAYNAATGQYKVYNPLLPFTDYLLVPGQAYWILVTASGTLAYSP